MEYSKIYKKTMFSEDVLRNFINHVEKLSKEKASFGVLAIYREDHTWKMDSLDDFFIEYNHGFSGIYVGIYFGNNYHIKWSLTTRNYEFEIGIRSPNKQHISKLISFLDSNQDKCNIDWIYSSNKKPPIFIGHGGKNDWKELRDHLSYKHQYDLKFYESSDRSSEYLFDNVLNMIKSSKLSILILSKEDKLSDGTMVTRQNVIHELGLSHGYLGRINTLVVIENGCYWPSNIQGIEIFQYTNSIKETFGDLISAIEHRMFDLLLGPK